MATEKLRAELELITKNAEKDLARLDRSLAGVEKRVKSIGGRGGRSLKPLGDGLSAATANASEFEKSMAAANARVIAFGASAGLIFQVQKALKETVRATVEVEKALTDINVVLGAGAKDLEKFGNSLFKVAAQTGQSFKTIAVGATELARQGLGTEKTLRRLNDAMILSRLTGMGAEEAVSSLTAAVNSFNKAGITSAQVVNKMAKVDQAFAVSSDDLAKAISRVGSSAVDAGVSMDELLAITTAVQQRTARGGAVIGNAFKTIFTRIGRTDVQKKLADIGVATRDMQGQMLPATRVLENLSQKFQTLSQVQQNQIAESVAGVFQVNILRAALGDLSSKYGVYTRAIKESSTATDEAYQKNAQLNQTLDALVNKTLANLTKAGASIGGATLKPAIENVLGFVNSAIEAFGEGGRFEKFGQGIGKDLLKGVGDFIAGPGLAIITYGVGRLLVNFGGFAKQALGGILELNKNVALRKNIEASVTAELSRQPAIIKQIQSGELSAAAAAKDMLAAMKASNVEATKLAITSRAIASSMMGVPGGMRGMRGAGRADGFVPNFANPNAERAAAAAGGYKAGGIRTMSIPGQGAVMYNSAETVKQFPGMKQPAIMPPQGSLAGSNYQKAFGAAHGFDPYAAGGFVPNFNIGAVLGGTKATRGMTLDQAIEAGLTRQQLSSPMAFGKEAVDKRLGVKSEGGKPVTKGTQDVIKETMDVKKQLGIVSLYGNSKGVRQDAKSSMKLKNLAVFREYVARNPKAGEERIQFTGVQVATLKGLEERVKKKGGGKTFSDSLNDHILEPLARVGAETIGGVLGNQGPRIDDIRREMRGRDLVPRQSEGELFETAIKLALHDKKRFIASIDGSPTAPFDFEEGKAPTRDFKTKLGFHENLVRADAKRTSDKAAVDSVIKKAYNQHVLIEAQLAKGPLLKELGALPLVGKIDQSAAAKRLEHTAPKSMRPGRAYGLVPNFSPLGDAITRERAAGVPASAIRVGSSAALKSSGNPGGLGVYNTIHEPAGLGQGISRSRRMGINPKSHGVPNFADGYGPGSSGFGPAGKASLGAEFKAILSEAKITGAMFPGGRPVDKSLYSGRPLSLAIADEKARVLTEALSELAEETRKNTEITKADKKAYAKEMRRSPMGRMGRMGGAVKGGLARFDKAGGFSTLGMGIGTIGYMAAPAIAKKTGIDEGGLQGALMGSMAGMAGPSMAALLGLGPVGGAVLGAGLIGAGALGGYNLMKSDPDDKAFEDRFARIQGVKEEQQKLASTLTAMTGGITNLMQTEGLSDKAKKDRLVALQKLRDEAVAAGGAVGVDEQTIRSIYDKTFSGDLSGADEQQKAIVESLAQADREATLTVLDQSLSKFSKTGDVAKIMEGRNKGRLYEILQKEAISRNFGSDIRAVSEMMSDPAIRSQMPEQTRRYGRADFILGQSAMRQGRALDSFITKQERGEILRAVQSTAFGEDGMVEMQRRALLGQGMKGQGSRRDLIRGEMENLFGKEMVEEMVEKGAGFENAFKAASENLVKSGEIAEEYFDTIFGTKVPEELRDTVLMANKQLFAYEKFSQAEREFLNKRATVYADQTDANKKFIGQLLDDSLNLQRAKAAFQASQKVELGKNVIAQRMQATRDASAINMATITGGEMAGLQFARGQVDPSMTKAHNLKMKGLNIRARGIFTNQLMDAQQTAIGSLATATGMGTANFNAYQPTPYKTVTNKFTGESVSRLGDRKETLAAIKARDEINFLKDFKTEADPLTDPEGATKEFQEAVRQRIINLQAIDGLGKQEENAVKHLIKTLQDLNTSSADLSSQRKVLTDLLPEEIKAAEEAIDAKIEEANARRVFSQGAYRDALNKELSMSQTTVQGLEALHRRGVGITGAQKADAAGRARRARIADGQGFQGLGGMRDAFSYNANDAALEFDAAMVDFGQTIKDSTKGAVKDIISGAKSFEDAMYNVFATLADKIANQGISQGVDSIFGSLFGRRHGGKIPGYNQGGVVAGGSGVRDDVLTMMQGGEYVIKKSSAQKIGYGTLNAINGYANGGKARVSLAKEFLFTGDDPKRPTGGKYNVSRNLSTAAMFRQDDPQTANMFGKEETLTNYLEYRRREQDRRDKILDDIKKKKRARLMNAYMSAGLRIGAGFIGGNFGPQASSTAAVEGGTGSGALTINPAKAGSNVPEFPMARGGSPALLMGGEYVMSPRTTAKYGTGFMAELNRGKVPGYAQGGMVGGGGGGAAGGITTNNVNLSINIDKTGNAQVDTQEQDSKSGGQDTEHQEAEKSKQFADAIRSAVQKEITKQQRPGGLLRDGATYAAGRRV